MSTATTDLTVSLIASWMLYSFLDTASGVEGALSFTENMIAVAAFLVMMVLVYLLGQKYIVAGMVEGAVK